MKKIVNIGILGLGTVGSGVVKTLSNFNNINIKKIAVKDLSKNRNIEGLSQEILTNKPEEIVNDSEIQVVVELIGGIEPAFKLIKAAIRNGKHIVTANKALIAKHADELFELANQYNVVILFEAAVAGGIPIIMPLQTSLAGNKISKVAGILNGTTNYILTKMTKDGASYFDVLKEAQDLGYAEADPTSDVEGYDAMYKIAIVASLAFGKKIDISKIYREGINKITPVDIAYAKEFGYKIKLIGLAQLTENNKVDIRVHPMLISKSLPLSKIENALNGIVIEGFPINNVMFSGPGAGEFPTASSVLGDILAIAKELEITDHPLPMMRINHKQQADQVDIFETYNKYFIRVNTKNAVGVIGELGEICGRNNISVLSIIQKGKLEDETARIVLITEVSLEKDIQEAISQMKNSPKVNEVSNVIRVMD